MSRNCNCGPESCEPGMLNLEANKKQGPEPGGPKKRSGRRSRISREDIIRTAATSFYAEGYVNTTLADVARQLGVTDKAIYYYFRNKDTLYLEVINRCADWLSAVLESIAENETTGLEKIKAFARTVIRQSSTRQPYLRCLPGHLENSAPGRRFRALEEEHEAILVGWIRDGIADGSIQAADPQLLWQWNQGALLWLDTWARSSGNYNPDIVEKAAMTMLDRSLGAASGPHNSQ
jgi:TetR/AcrR family transcriptional regulator, cholesterol catabolism regulator